MDRPCINCHQYFDIREHYGKCPYCKFDNFKNKNMKNFKDGQKVRHPKYGEGVINIDRWENIYVVTFNEVNRVTSPIGDDFYNQLEPVEDLPNIGEYCYLWNYGSEEAVYAKLGGLGDVRSKFKYRKMGFATYYQHISKTPPKFD